MHYFYWINNYFSAEWDKAGICTSNLWSEHWVHQSNKTGMPLQAWTTGKLHTQRAQEVHTGEINLTRVDPSIQQQSTIMSSWNTGQTKFDWSSVYFIKITIVFDGRDIFRSIITVLTSISLCGQIIRREWLPLRQPASLSAIFMRPSQRWRMRTSAFPGTTLRWTQGPVCAPLLKPGRWGRKLIQCPATCARYFCCPSPRYVT